MWGEGHRQMEGIEVEKRERILCDRVFWGVCVLGGVGGGGGVG